MFIPSQYCICSGFQRRPALFKEALGHLGEGDVAEHILLALRLRAQLFSGPVEYIPGQSLGEAALHGAAAAKDPGPYLRVDGAGVLPYSPRQ